ncbi:MAG: hypothetical protein ACI92S_003079, partial [Planctomycetaceae bacterium]
MTSGPNVNRGVPARKSESNPDGNKPQKLARA